MQIATLGISQEANTFSSVPGDLAQGQRAGILEGAQIVERFASAQTTISGFLEFQRTYPDVEVVPLLFSRVTPMEP